MKKDPRVFSVTNAPVLTMQIKLQTSALDESSTAIASLTKILKTDAKLVRLVIT